MASVGGGSSGMGQRSRLRFREELNMRGRWPQGPEYIDKLTGSVEDKERLKAVLDTMYGERRMLEVCGQLGIGETRFHQLRETALQAALSAIAPRPAGRPSRAALPESEQIRLLEQRTEELEQALHEAQVRAEIALVLPHLRQSEDHGEHGSTVLAEGKKMRRRRVKIRKPR